MPEYIFIYDHHLLRGQEDSNADPMDAILYFYPPTVSQEQQHSLASHVAGTCQILANILQSPPTLFSLDTGAQIACLHIPDTGLIQNDAPRTFTFALYCDNTHTNHNITEKCLFLYESFIFYLNKCFLCIFPNGNRSKSKFINMLFNKLTMFLNSRDKISNIFHLNPFCNPYSQKRKDMDDVCHQNLRNLMDQVRIEIADLNVRVIGGCLFHKSELMVTQIPVELSSLFSMIIQCVTQTKNVVESDNLFLPIRKNMIDIEKLKPRHGTHLLQVCLCHRRYLQLLNQSAFRSSVSDLDNTNSCCNTGHCHRILLYLEHHSETSIIFVIDDFNSEKITELVLKHFSNLCFQHLGDFEAHIWTAEDFQVRDSTKTESSTSSSSVQNPSLIPIAGNTMNLTPVNSHFNEWNMIYDEREQNLEISTNISSNGGGGGGSTSSQSGISLDWEDTLSRRTQDLHEVMKQEQDISEIQARFPKESISVSRSTNFQIYNVKKYN